MARPSVRHPFERRTRIRRALQLRRRQRAQRAGMVLASVVVLVASMGAVWSLVRTFGGEARVDRLQVTDGAGASAAPSAVWLEIPPVQPPPTPAAPPTAAPVPASQPLAAPQARAFNGRPVKAVRTMRMLVTAYCPCSECCGTGSPGKTASGYSVWTNGGHLVAADTRVLPFGSMISVPGYDGGDIVPVLDRGGRIKGHRLDVLFPTHRQAKKWGSRWLDVTVYDYAD